jgi:hypothetical protein
MDLSILFFFTLLPYYRFAEYCAHAVGIPFSKEEFLKNLKFKRKNLYIQRNKSIISDSLKGYQSYQFKYFFLILKD